VLLQIRSTCLRR